MQFQMRGNDLQISDRMRDVASERAARLERFVPDAVDAKIELRHAHTRTGPDQIVAQGTIHTPKAILRAEVKDPDAVHAIELVMERLERQSRRYHERIGDKRTRAVEPIAPPIEEAAEEATMVVRRKKFPVKPMDEAEAIEQMALLGHDFFLYQDRDLGSVALLYRRRDGELGLLVPESM